MALFNTDLEAFIYLVLIVVGLLILNVIIKAVTSSKRVSAKTRIIIKFSFSLISLAIILYFILSGFPIISEIPQTYVAIITSSVSTAVAFASSGIFDNVVSGLALLAIKPYDLNDVIKLKGLIGVVRDLKLTKTVIETFDNVKVQISNKDVINTELTNYSIKLDKIKNFVDFKRVIHYSEDNEFPPIESEGLKQEESSLKNIFNKTIHRKDNPKIHNYIWKMEFPYERFRLALKRVEEICKNYEKRFDFKPTYHIDGFGNFIEVRFRILTTDSKKIFNIQPEFANEIYKVVHEMWEKI
ncbi:MAG: mechanosensitive ion channel domain-containing protein [Promethearchaeati archaeon]